MSIIFISNGNNYFDYAERNYVPLDINFYVTDPEVRQVSLGTKGS